MLKTIHILIVMKKFNDKDPKIKVGGDVRISNYKNVFAKS